MTKVKCSVKKTHMAKSGARTMSHKRPAGMMPKNTPRKRNKFFGGA